MLPDCQNWLDLLEQNSFKLVLASLGIITIWITLFFVLSLFGIHEKIIERQFLLALALIVYSNYL